jgi:hypothetical protein
MSKCDSEKKKTNKLKSYSSAMISQIGFTIFAVPSKATIIDILLKMSNNYYSLDRTEYEGLLLLITPFHTKHFKRTCPFFNPDIASSSCKVSIYLLTD